MNNILEQELKPKPTPLMEYEKRLGKTLSPFMKESRLRDTELTKQLNEHSKMAPILPKPKLLPSSVDYSQFIHFVRNQGGWGCGMYAATACWDIQNERKFPYSPNISVNRQLWAFVFEIIQKQPIPYDGKTASTVEEYLTNYGCPTEGTELTNSDAVQWPTIEGTAECPHFKMVTHPTPIQVTVQELKTALSVKGPLRIVVWGNHFVALIGYDDAKQRFKFINSWGDDWGSGGFGYIEYANLNQEVSGAEFYDFAIQPMPTARIAFKSSHRQDIYLWLGVENQTNVKRIWPDGQLQDNSKNLNLTVTLPVGFQWPPKKGSRLYLDVFDSGAHSEAGGELTEFTATSNGKLLKCNGLKVNNKFLPHKSKRFYIS